MRRLSLSRLLLTTTVYGLAFSSPWVCAQEQVRWKHLSSHAGDLPAPGVGNQAAAVVFDIDKDGADDFVIAGWGTPSMVWFRRVGETWQRYLVDDRGSHIEAGGDYFDINGDGHLDIYAAEMFNPGAGAACRQMVLYGDGKGGFTTQIVSTGIGTHEGKLGDLDGDGDVDILQKGFQEQQRVDIWLNQQGSRARKK